MRNSTYFLVTAFALLTSAWQTSAQPPHRLVKLWSTDAALKVPESVLFDSAHKVLYVSNIDGQPDGMDAKGSIGKVGIDGKIIAADWVPGLNAPKGMALVKNWLWVADVDEMAVVEINSGRIIKIIPVPGAQFLNDVTAAEDGTVYVSDSKTKIIHRIKDGQPEVFISGLQGPNGLKIYKGELYVLDKGGLYKTGTDRKLIKIADGMEEDTDGLEHVQGNDFLVSCWGGTVYYVHGNGTKEKLLDTRGQGINSADIGYDPKTKTVYIPTFFKNSIVAYKLQ